MAQNLTQPTDVPVEDFLDGVTPAVRAADARQLVELYRDVTGLDPVMWGPSIIGFGEHVYEASHGVQRTALMAFSPRKANLTLYFTEGFDPHADDLVALGPHKTSRACLYLTRLSHVDMDVLRRMLEKSLALAQPSAE